MMLYYLKAVEISDIQQTFGTGPNILLQKISKSPASPSAAQDLS